MTVSRAHSTKADDVAKLFPSNKRRVTSSHAEYYAGATPNRNPNLTLT